MQEYIEVRGARENNLKNISLKVPKRKITIFTGVSGSGKSSLVFDTIAAESQRLHNENFSIFVRSFLPRISQPDADSITNLNMAVVVDQKPLGGGPQSTVGTVTDIATALRVLFSRFGQPHIGNANKFSFNNSAGMCRNCNGMGRKMNVDVDTAFDRTKSINEGAIRLPDYQNGEWSLELLKQSKLFDLESSARFYHDVFGWSLRHHEDGSIAFDDNTATSRQVSGMWVTGRPPLAKAGTVISIMVDDAEKTVGNIIQHGGGIIRPLGFNPQERIAWFRDPGGNILGIYQEP